MKKILLWCLLAILSLSASAQAVIDYPLENLQTTDTYIRSSLPDNSFATSTSLITGGWGDVYKSMIKFNISPLPLLATGDRVSVWFYNISPGGAAQPTDVKIGLAATDFSETTTWNNSNLMWYSSTIRTVTVNSYNKWFEFDITDYFNYWKIGGMANYGFYLIPVNANNNFNFFQSSSTSTPSGQKPFLRITKANSNRMFSFPLTCTAPLVNGSCNTASYSNGAYTPGKVISILDHDMTTPYEKDGRMTSFTGEQFATTTAYPTSAWAPCYPKVGGAGWSSTLQSLYVGDNSYNKGVSRVLNCLSGVAVNYDGHTGYDYKANYNTPVYAAKDGIVISNAGQICVPKGMSNNCSAFNAVGIDHWNGYITQYLHLGSISVTAGQVVKQGDLIGLSGDTGVTGSPHLHFEVLKRRPGYLNGDYQIGAYATVDPYGYDTSSGVQDVLANSNGTPSVCLWLSGCTLP